MKVIHKFKLEIKDIQHILLPKYAEIINISAMYLNEVYLWAIVNPNNPKVTKTFRMVDTGEDFNDEAQYEYFSTVVIQDVLVKHIFMKL